MMNTSASCVSGKACSKNIYAFILVVTQAHIQSSILWIFSKLESSSPPDFDFLGFRLLQEIPENSRYYIDVLEMSLTNTRNLLYLLKSLHKLVRINARYITDFLWNRMIRAGLTILVKIGTWGICGGRIAMLLLFGRHFGHVFRSLGDAISRLLAMLRNLPFKRCLDVEATL